MNVALQALLARYEPHTLADYENALKEVIQELALLGLWRAKFYENAAFYGGTALRIFHGLPRFSEDMDFSLLAPAEGFGLEPYLEAIRRELASFGFSFRVERRSKRVSTAVESAFIKEGRDFYDFVWYRGRGIRCDVGHLQARMEQTGHWQAGTDLDVAHLRRLLARRFEQVDFDQARSDVRPFIRDDAELALWDRTFFQALAAQVEGA